jgi:hypothetical protein
MSCGQEVDLAKNFFGLQQMAAGKSPLDYGWPDWGNGCGGGENSCESAVLLPNYSLQNCS